MSAPRRSRVLEDDASNQYAAAPRVSASVDL